jgi:hypothetical protein
LATYYSLKKGGIEHDECVKQAFQTIIDNAQTMVAYNAEVTRIKLVQLLIDYFELYRDCDWEILEVEKEFKVEVSDDLTMPVVVDLIVRVPGKGIHVVDHKFSYDLYNPDVMDINPQLPKYVAALRLSGIAVQGAIYNEIRYREFKDPKPPSQLMRRTPITLTSKRVTTTVAEQIKAAKRIDYLRSLPQEEWEDKILRVANSNVCKSCPFTNICINDLNGYPRQALLEHGYKKRVRRQIANQ